MRARIILVSVLTLLAILVGVAVVESATLATFEKHDLRITLDVPNQQATISDKGTVRVNAGWNFFYLNQDAKVGTLSVGGTSVDYHVVGSGDTAQLPVDIKKEMPKLETAGNPLLVFFQTKQATSVPFEVVLTAKLHDSVENVQFSRESVGNEVRATIGEQGAYLSPAAYFYPIGDEKLVQFSVTVDMPGNWLSVSDGNPGTSTVENGRRIETFANPYVNDGLSVMVAPFVSRMETRDGVEVACYFFEADTSLAQGYLDAAAGYIKMYSDLIGPYPFKRFTIAENFFPTGYGFPAWTLLGQQVLRLPFIKTTSLGHEVLHNWWGNSVYVDYEKGNWCEGLTVYGADYRYKLMESEAAAKDYRKDILKEYVSYVNKGNDFPLREFKSRTSAETRSIGYNKAMMVFHMIEQQIGTQAFFDAWKLVYSQYKAKQVSWEDWVAAYEKTSGQKLSWVIPEWIDRAGAPVIGLDSAVLSQAGSISQGVMLKLSQRGKEQYHLAVPVRVELSRQFTSNPNVDTVFDTSVVLDNKSQLFGVTTQMGHGVVEVDPDYHLFRKLYPEEIEPIISGVMGVEKKRLVAYDASDANKSLYEAFGSSLTEGGGLVETAAILDEPTKDFAPVLLNPKEIPVDMAAMITTTDTSLTINGVAYLRKGHTFLLAGRNWNGFEKYLVVLSDDPASLPRIGQLAPHYGKYSYLVFEGAKNVGKGQWPTVGSPLKKTF